MAEVIRSGETMTVREVLPTDIVIKSDPSDIFKRDVEFVKTTDPRAFESTAESRTRITRQREEAAERTRLANEQKLRLAEQQKLSASERIIQKVQEQQRQVLIKQKQTGEFRGAPTFDIVTIEDGVERPATNEEAEYLRKTGLTAEGVTAPKSFFQRKRGEVQVRRREITQRVDPSIVTGAQTFALGSVSSFLGTLSFGQQLILDPSETLMQTVTGTKKFILNPRETGGRIGAIARRDPSFAVGFVVGEAVTFKGISLIPRGVTKVSDIIRTRKAVPIPVRSVVAPEIFKGQIFPAIRKGQTAGELFKEFTTRGGAFTAAPKPFGKITKVKIGKSEFHGLFQAPDLSAHFLRLAGEERKLFSFRFFDTLRPTAIKITGQDFRLAKAVTPTTKRPTGILKLTREEIKFAPKGVSTIPFAKVEKEAVLTAGTELQKIQRATFFEFKGRRIPVDEFRIVKGDSAKDLSESLKFKDSDVSVSSRLISQRGVVSPLEVSLVSTRLKPSEVSSVSLSSTLISTKKISSSIPSSKDISKSFVPSISSIKPSIKPSVSLSKSFVKTSIPSFVQKLKLSLIVPPTVRRPTGDFFIRLTAPSEIRPVVPKLPKKQRITRGYTTSIRRFGVFRPIITGVPLRQAFSLGRLETGRTLAATFKVTPTGKTKGVSMPTPAGFKRKKSRTGGIVFIEAPRLRLSTFPEVKEIQLARIK